MSISDEIGTWFDLGVVSPGYEWRLFPDSIVDGKIFRFTYTFDVNLLGQKSRFLEIGLVRFYYPTNPVSVGISTRIYPGLERRIISFDTGITLLRDIGVKKLARRSGVYRYLTPIDWQLKIEYLNNP